ncbi:hypothetical protein SCHPADRAFT_894140 [Schizopora paradoxa]|uniref:Uncharacterized protein n=1 Tax=Schizopora paradoxa TaxID=27342 RepID=A0A0H2R8E8_9AGAM|nr:hypothetical protein SCHPADRAFT_894140 [Schizopora paradoxa]
MKHRNVAHNKGFAFGLSFDFSVVERQSGGEGAHEGKRVCENSMIASPCQYDNEINAHDAYPGYGPGDHDRVWLGLCASRSAVRVGRSTGRDVVVGDETAGFGIFKAEGKLYRIDETAYEG